MPVTSCRLPVDPIGVYRLNQYCPRAPGWRVTGARRRRSARTGEPVDSARAPVTSTPPRKRARRGPRGLHATGPGGVRRAQVRISSPDIGTKTALTDAQGRYEFRDLPAGRFNVSVSKSGFVTMQFGQNRPYEPGRPIELVDGQVMNKADVALPRGSV